MQPNVSDPISPALDPQFASLVTRHQRSLYGYIMSLTPIPHDADDILQEVNVVLWRKAAEYDSTRDFLPWACTIAYYEVLAHRKRQQRDRHVFLDEALLRELATEARQAAEQFESRLAALRKCMEKLPERSRQLLRDRYDDREESIAAESWKSGRSAGAIYTALHRIRRVLLECIQQTLEPQQS